MGVKYNAGKYSGSYPIIPANPTEDISERGNDRESTEPLADIIETYSDFDSRTTQIGIDFSYPTTGEPIDFRIRINPTAGSQCIVSFSVASNEIKTGDEFEALIDLCTTTFERLDFVYGSYRNEYQEQIPTTPDEILNEPAQIITFFSGGIADEVGRGRLLSASAQEVRELNSGGVLLVACTDPQGCPDELRSLNAPSRTRGLSIPLFVRTMRYIRWRVGPHKAID